MPVGRAKGWREKGGKRQRQKKERKKKTNYRYRRERRVTETHKVYYLLPTE